MSHLESLVHVALSAALFLLVPVFLAFERFFAVSRSVILLALLGLYSIAGLAKPSVLPLWTIWIAAIASVFVIRRFRTGHREPIEDPLRFWPVVVLLLLSFALFLVRWDPPGIESAFTGAAARQVSELSWGGHPSNGGAVALLAAMAHLGHWAPLERLVAFFTGLGVALFAFTLASALGLWFDRTAAFVGALFALTAFPAPQAMLASGAAPAFFGLTSGLCVLEFAKVVLVRTGTPWEWGLYGVAAAFGAYCDPAAFLVSHLVCLPALVWSYRVCESHRRFLRNIGSVLGIAFVLAVPALWGWKLSEPPVGAVGGWPLAGIASLALGAVIWFRDRKIRYVGVGLAALAIAGSLVFLGRESYPSIAIQRLAETMAVFALAMPVASWVEHFTLEYRKRIRFLQGSVFGLFLAIGLHQFRAQLWQEFSAPELSKKDRRAMAYVESFVPAGDCVRIDARYAGRWIPTLSDRCVVTGTERAPWWFLADGEPRPPVFGEDPVFEGGALVYQLR